MKILTKKFATVSIIMATILLSACQSDNHIIKDKLDNSPAFFAPLSGINIDEDISNKPIFAVMFDNHPAARPQSGLNDAEIIYEYKVEGKYTRYMALFQKNEPEIIGPVRSARPYFVNTAAEYNAIYTHWGGSEAGYDQISKDNVRDLDGIFLEGSTFYRNKNVGKKAPHNGYTSYDNLIEASEEKNYLDDGINPKSQFKFDTSIDLDLVDKEMDNSPDAEEFTVEFFKNAHEMTFIYDENQNNYQILRNNEILTDEADEKEVRPSNIIVQYADSEITGPKLTLSMYNIGEGTGKLFTDGNVIDITWTKESDTSPTIFKTVEGEEIVLTPGQTFIEIIGTNNDLKIIEDIEDDDNDDYDNNNYNNINNNDNHHNNNNNHYND